MVLVCAASHPLAESQAVELELLQDENFIGFDSDLTIRRELDRVLQLHDVEVRVVMEFDNVETMKRAVEIGAGVSHPARSPPWPPKWLAERCVAVRLATDELVRPLGIIHRRGKELSSTTRRFIDLLQSEGCAADSPTGARRSWRAAQRTAAESRGRTPRPANAWRRRRSTSCGSTARGAGDRTQRLATRRPRARGESHRGIGAGLSAAAIRHSRAGGNGNGSRRKPAAVATAGRVKAK